MFASLTMLARSQLTNHDLLIGESWIESILNLNYSVHFFLQSVEKDVIHPFSMAIS